MRTKLEEGLAAKIKVPKGKKDVMVFDTEQDGLFLRKFATGKAVYGVRYYVAGKARQKHLVEIVPGVNGLLAKARKMAGDVRAKARLGGDVLAEERTKRAEAKAQGETIEKLAKAFLADRKDQWKPRYRDEVERHLTTDWKPLAKTPIKAVTRQKIVDTLDGIAAGQGKVAADRARAALSSLFSWAIERGKVETTPMLKMKARAGNIARDRVLTPAELREVWAAADARRDDYSRIVKLLILTGCRRDEIGRLPWEQVNEHERRLELPGGVDGVTKNRRKHLVPLDALALAQLPARPDPRDPASRTMVFGRRHYTGFSGWAKAKRELDAAIAAARKQRGLKEAMPAWRLHDLRRTFVTLVAEQGIALPHVIEAIVNHVSGHKAGVAGVYNKALYWEERVQAIKGWNEYIVRAVCCEVRAI